MTAVESQPSPVSVLEYKDESASPSPIMKRCIDFKDQREGPEYDDEFYYIPAISPIGSKTDPDLVYITSILKALTYLPAGTDVFLIIEKQQYPKWKNGSKRSRLERMAIFDTVVEILERHRQLPPWKPAASSPPSLDQIWQEFQNLRHDNKEVVEEEEEEDPLEMILGLVRKDLGREEFNGWEETSEAVLDIERMIFKDLINETIRDEGLVKMVNSLTTLSRRLVF